jgi:hypothetical protein
MILWADVKSRQIDHEQRVQGIEQTHWMQVEALPAVATDRWHWRVMNKLGGWLVELGCRLQTHVEQARQIVHTSHMAVEAKSNSTPPRP